MAAAMRELVVSWQQESEQGVIPEGLQPCFVLLSCSQSAAGSLGACAGEPAECAWPWIGHMPSAQQDMVFVCHAAAHRGDHSRKMASRHTEARSFFPRADGVWSDCRMS